MRDAEHPHYVLASAYRALGHTRQAALEASTVLSLQSPYTAEWDAHEDTTWLAPLAREHMQAADEATLVQHPAVLEAAVIGKTDADGLLKTKSFVVLKDGCSATEAELKAFVKQRLAAYKYPRFIEFVDELPKTATGKIQRFRLREREASVG